MSEDIGKKLDVLINLMTSMDARLGAIQSKLNESNQNSPSEIPKNIQEESIGITEIQSKFADAMNEFNESFKPKTGTTKYQIGGMRVKFKGVPHFDSEKKIRMISPDKVTNVDASKVAEMDFELKAIPKLKNIQSTESLRRLRAMKESISKGKATEKKITKSKTA